jgi:N-acetylglucosaminyl-diphospho-decaprenol L-rhamnosyltransferase
VSADVAVVIVTYNSAHVVVPLLDSLPAALDGLEADVVVVDNGSTDATRDVVSERHDCRLVASSNGGYAAGINLGVRAAEPAPYILVLNPDVRVHPGAVMPLVDACRAPGVGIVAPRVYNEDGSLHLSLRRETTLLRSIGLSRTGLPLLSEHVSAISEYDRPHGVDWALGAVLLVSRACHDALDGWDESYFLYSEETDFSLRARDAGFMTWYEPRASAVHIGAQSGESPRTHAIRSVNRVRLYRRRHGSARSWLYLLLTLAFEASWAVRSRSWLPVVALLRPSRRPPELNCSAGLMPR